MERAWMAEKDRLLREMDLAKQQANVNMRDAVALNMSMTSQTSKVDPEEVKVSGCTFVCSSIPL